MRAQHTHIGLPARVGQSKEIIDWLIDADKPNKNPADTG